MTISKEMSSTPSSHPTLKGVIIFSVLILGSSLVQMHKIYVDRDWYYQMFSGWPVWLITVRYTFSWAQRIVGITAAVGVLFYNNLYRKLALLIGTFTIFTVYWKHPYEGFLRSTQYLDKQIPAMASYGVSFEELTRAAQITHWAIDILFWIFWIWYFLHPRVKAAFIKNRSSA